MGCHFLLQGIFLTQGSNPRLLHCLVDSLPLNHLGSPKNVYKQANCLMAEPRQRIASHVLPLNEFFKAPSKYWILGILKFSIYFMIWFSVDFKGISFIRKAKPVKILFISWYLHIPCAVNQNCILMILSKRTYSGTLSVHSLVTTEKTKWQFFVMLYSTNACMFWMFLSQHIKS